MERTDRYRRILRAVQQGPWAIVPEKLQQIAEVLTIRAEGGALPTSEDVHRIEAAQRGKIVSSGGIAVLPLIGTISRRMGMLEAMSGGTSIETFSKNFAELVDDESISAIVIDIDSPGGSVYGVPELARQIYDARSKKRIIAVADQLMASAAYWIGSAADQLVITPSGEVGSIGVYSVHFDFSQNLESDGVAVTIIRAGENKAEGNPYEPLDDDAAAHLQSIVDDYYRMFTSAVARHRGVGTDVVESEFGQGRTYTAERAVDRGMADRIGTLEEVLSDLTAKGNMKTRRRAAEEPHLDVAAFAPALSEMRAAFLPDALVVRAVGDAGSPTVTAGTTPSGAESPLIPGRSPFSSANEAINDALRTFMSRAQPVASESRDEPSDEDADAAAGHAADGDPNLAPTEPAPAAREDSMSPVDTAPQTGAEADDRTAAALEESRAEARAAEQKRIREINAIGRDYGIDAEKVNGWIDRGLSVDEVKSNILDGLKNADGDLPVIRVGHDRSLDKPFQSLGHQLQLIAAAGRSPETTDPRLRHLNDLFYDHAKKQAAASGSSISVPSDGGFVLQPDFVPGITSKMWDEGRVLSRTNKVPIGENSNRLVRNHIKESSRKDGSRYGGVRVYRKNEADTVNASNPKLVQQVITLESLLGIYYATEETIQDAVALTVEAENGFRKELTFVAENEIFRGTGAGQCLGILNCNALVSVAAESAQTAATVNATNVAKMMARLPAGSFPTGAWFIHSSVIPQLVLMTVGDQPVFLPGGNIAGAPFGTLFGMPVIPLEYCSTVGTVGDIVLADLMQYTTIDKRGARWEESIHVRFIYEETTFRLAYRFNGQPDWEDKVAEFQGSDYISPFVVLATRS